MSPETNLIDAIIRTLRPLQFRGKKRLLNRLVPTSGTRSATIHGFSTSLDLSDLIQREMYLGVYERRETQWVKQMLRPGMTFIDVGANVGYFTYLAARIVGPTGRVIAFEPSAVVFARLRDAIEQAQARYVQVENLGLDAIAGNATLYIPPPSVGNHSPTLVPTPGWEPVTVELETLDGYCKHANVDRVDLLKMDVEGCERDVLEGATALLKGQRVDAILLEFNDYWLRQRGTTPDDLAALLQSHGFRDVDAAKGFAKGGIDTRLFRRAIGDGRYWI